MRSVTEGRQERWIKRRHKRRDDRGQTLIKRLSDRWWWKKYTRSGEKRHLTWNQFRLRELVEQRIIHSPIQWVNTKNPVSSLSSFKRRSKYAQCGFHSQQKGYMANLTLFKMHLDKDLWSKLVIFNERELLAYQTCTVSLNTTATQTDTHWHTHRALGNTNADW